MSPTARSKPSRGVSLSLQQGPDRHGDRAERRRQDHAARRAIGLLPSRGRLMLRGRRSAQARRRGPRRARLLPGAGDARAVRRDDGLRQSRARRLSAPSATAPSLPARSRRSLWPLSAARRTPRAARRHAVGRRAPDARAWPRPDVGAAAADARRAEPRPRAADRARHLAHRAGLRDAGVSILLVEQNARAALEIADYGYVLETGEIVLDGEAGNLLGNARVQASYLGGRA